MPFVDALAVDSDGDVFAGTFEGGGVYRLMNGSERGRPSTTG